MPESAASVPQGLDLFPAPRSAASPPQAAKHAEIVLDPLNAGMADTCPPMQVQPWSNKLWLRGAADWHGTADAQLMQTRLTLSQLLRV